MVANRDAQRITVDEWRELERSSHDNSDVAVRLSARRYTYPAATVTCDERDRTTPDKSEVEAPRLIVEVLSDSTEAYDRGRKFSFYRACPTIEEYVLVSTSEQTVEVYRRTGTEWAIYQAYGPGEQITLISLGIHIAVATLYRNSSVPETIDDTEGEV